MRPLGRWSPLEPPRGATVRIIGADLFDARPQARSDVARAGSAPGRWQPSLGHQLRAWKPGEHDPAPTAQRQGDERARGSHRGCPISTPPKRSGSSSHASSAARKPTIALLCKTCGGAQHPPVSPVHNARFGCESRRSSGSTRPAGLARPSMRVCFVSRSATRRRGHDPLATCARCIAVLAEREPESVMGFAQGWLVADIGRIERWAFADGRCPMNWRQGLKHDAAGVMELGRDPVSGQWRNRAGEFVDVEPDFIYPLIKGADLARSLGPAGAARRAGHAGATWEPTRHRLDRGAPTVALSPVTSRDLLETQVIDLSWRARVCALRDRAL